ncbi:MAG: ATP-binding protein [Chloroflexota bacterium]
MKFEQFFSEGYQRLNSLFSWLTEPAASITDSAEQRHARALSGMILSLTIVLAFYAPWLFYTTTPSILILETIPIELISLLMGINVGAFLYWYSRRQLPSRVINLMILIMCGPFLFWCVYTNQFLAMFSMTVFVAYAALFMSQKRALQVTLFSTIVMVAGYTTQQLFAPRPSFILTFYETLGIYWVLSSAHILLSFLSFSDKRQIEQQAESLRKEIIEREKIEQALKQSEERNRALLEAIPDGIILANREGDVLFAQQPKAFQGRYLASDLIGKNVYQLPESDVVEMFKESIHMALDTMQVQTSDYRLQSNGQWRTRESRVAPVNQNEVMIINRDVTEIRHHQNELQEAKEAAEAASNAKSTFLANVSHELRTPLNVILGFTQLMAKDPASSSEQVQQLGVIQRSGRYLLDLINDVLEISKIEAGHVNQNQNHFDLPLMLTTLVEMFTLRAATKGIQVRLEADNDLPRIIMSDEQKLRQILTNLMGNAIKFTQAGQITLMAHRVKSKSPTSRLIFAVKDTGIGIRSEKLDHIFEIFARAEDNSIEEGTGLGLPISQQYVRMLGGELQVESAPNQGSTFRFEINYRLATTDNNKQPLHEQKVIGIKSDGVKADEQKEYKVLIVEDNRENRTLLRLFLGDIGLHCREAINGQMAVDAVAECKPDLIFMDMRMPVMDGYEATRVIRQQYGRDLPIVALTADAFEHQRLEILDIGCDMVISKPYRQRDVYHAIESLLPLVFIYADNTESTINHRRNGHHPTKVQTSIEDLLSQERLATLPKGWLAQFKVFASMADVEECLIHINTIRQQDKALAETFVNLVNHFQFERILALGDTKISDIMQYTTKDMIQDIAQDIGQKARQDKQYEPA